MIVCLMLMGYRGGAPSWVYKNQMSSQAASYQQEISKLNERIKSLEEENKQLKKRIKQLEEKKELAE